MSKLRVKAIRQMNEQDLKDRVEQMRTELSKLEVENAKGTLRKESGKIKPTKRNIARLLTILKEKRKKWNYYI